MSHTITETQKKDAKENYGIEKFIIVDNSLWKQIPVTVDKISPILKHLIEFIANKCNNGDYLFVQGDFGATYLMVNFAFKNGLIPVYATSKREVKEELNGEQVISIRSFKHICFREYEIF